MSDDPVPGSIRLPPDATLDQLAGCAAERVGLPTIHGGKATWILEAGVPLAVFAQQWEHPRLLLPPETPVASLPGIEAKPGVHFRYWCQVDPDEVFECLRDGRTLPDRSGRDRTAGAPRRRR